MRFAACLFLILAGLPQARASAADSDKPNLRRDVVFDRYTPLSSSMELARRLLTPLSFERLRQVLLAKPGLRAQPIDLAQEKFAVYVPAGPPPKQGYGLLAFIPPWPEAALPAGWSGPLDRHGIIYVTATNSGNNADVMDRRMPLALLEVENMRKRYALDSSRIYVGGMSGGSRVALHLALAYPDVFRGVLLNAGSDPIGEPPLFLPPADLFATFQTSMRVVYLTGAYDAANLQRDSQSRRSLRNWCVFDVQSITSPWQGHEVANAAGLARALDALDQHHPVDAAQLASCRERIGTALASSLAKAQATLRRGDIDDAHAQLDTIDRRYGGVAAAGVLKLQGELDRHH